MSTPVSDQQVRDRALDPAASFIVQAPAGSGKTGLLTQRYLRLLAAVERPESIVAITFTRKAAAEMRERILQALRQARTGSVPTEAHERRTRELAEQALRQDQARGWELLANPGRLRIQTFDSFCGWLAAQMPLLSGFGANPAVVEDAWPLYLQAAEAALTDPANPPELASLVTVLLGHLDNRLDSLRDLLAGMLARRDQWLRHVADPDHPRLERDNIERALRHLIEEALRRLHRSLPEALQPELLDLLRFAADQVSDDSPLRAFRDCQSLPPASAEALADWNAIAGWLLTNDGNWRKSVTVRQGFPAQSAAANAAEKARFAEMKRRMQELLAALGEHGEFRLALSGLAGLPAACYRDEEWQVLDALFTLLGYAVAWLRLVFQEHGEVDFAEVALRAIQALGQEDAPTDLALRLDCQIRHLLVDEFQDTSINQYELLRHLIAGWEEGDGRSLFLVGDPMQSIYRFREAEVGLFLETCERGLGPRRLEFLQLQVNFRSRRRIIDWANDAFPRIFPERDDPARGMVRYAPSLVAEPARAEGEVQIHPLIGRDDEAEGRAVVALVRAARAASPPQSVAVLVRTRRHLAETGRQLRAAGIAFQAIDIEALAARPVVQDLLALTRALLHPADRIAWLSLLRAPFCGLTLADLHSLCLGAPLTCVADLLADGARLAGLSEDGRQRLARVWPLLQQAQQNRDRQNLRAQVESLWLALGGPACVEDEAALADAESFLRLLTDLETWGDGDPLTELARRMEKLFAHPDAAGADVQLMTIHKAKGLEFDTVILPGLGKSPRADDPRLLYWLEQPGPGEEPDLLFGPIRPADGQESRIADYIRRLERDKAQQENLRLLYVAATRARRALHLFGHVETNGEGELRSPANNSLLACLWPVVAPRFEEALARDAEAAAVPAIPAAEPAAAGSGRRRLPAGWQCPPPPPSPALAVEEETAIDEPPAEPELEFDWAGETARLIGVVVHRFLEQIARAGIEHYRPPAAGFAPLASVMLAEAGVLPAAREAAAAQVARALSNTLEDERGRWILSGRHRQASCELALGVRLGDSIRRQVIDRSFVDEAGTRWIIDYKTGAHSGGGLEEFLERELQRYRPQLQGYARALREMESRPIRMALYFPLLRAWREWDGQ